MYTSKSENPFTTPVNIKKIIKFITTLKSIPTKLKHFYTSPQTYK